MARINMLSDKYPVSELEKPLNTELREYMDQAEKMALIDQLPEEIRQFASQFSVSELKKFAQDRQDSERLSERIASNSRKFRNARQSE